MSEASEVFVLNVDIKAALNNICFVLIMDPIKSHIFSSVLVQTK